MKKILGKVFVVLIHVLLIILIIVLIGIAVVLFYIPTMGIIHAWKEGVFLHTIVGSFFTEDGGIVRVFVIMYFFSFVLFYIVYGLIKMIKGDK